jgi:hypothetical protein
MVHVLGNQPPRAGTEPILRGVDDVVLELLEHRSLDGHTQELVHGTR